MGHRIALVACGNGFGHGRRSLAMAVEFNRRGHHVTWFGPTRLFTQFRNLVLSSLTDESRFEVVPFDTGTSAERFCAAPKEALTWHLRLPPLQAFDLVISDNLPEILHLRPDAVLSGHFLWSHVLVGLPPDIEASEAELLKKHKPPILSGHPFTFPQLRSYPQLIEIGLCSFPGHERESRDGGHSLLLSAGQGGNVSARLEKFIASLIDAKPPVFATVYAEPHLLKKHKAPSWLKPATYSSAMYQDVAAAICRPGIGTVTDCLLNSVRILAVSEPENLEVQNNGRILGELGLGELCMTFADAYRRAHAYMDNTLARDAQREAIRRQISFQGHREAVDFCERQLQNL